MLMNIAILTEIITIMSFAIIKDVLTNYLIILLDEPHYKLKNGHKNDTN